MELKNTLKKEEQKLKKIYRIVLACLTVIVGVLFLYQLLGIYFREAVGDTYTRELVIQKLTEILAPIIVWITLIVIGGIFWLAYPDGEPNPKRDDVYILNRMKKRIPLFVDDGKNEIENKLKQEEENVKLVKIISLCLTIAFCVYFLVYMFLPSSFTDKTYANEEVAKMLIFILPVLALIFGVNIFAGYYELSSAKRQIPLVKALTAGQKAVTETEVVNENKEVLIIKVTRLAVLLLGVTLIVLGVLNGGMKDVLIKAINICTECIGLG